MWAWVSATIALFGGGIMTWIAWVAEQPAWAAGLIGLSALMLILGSVYFILGALQKREQLKMYQKNSYYRPR